MHVSFIFCQAFGRTSVANANADAKSATPSPIRLAATDSKDSLFSSSPSPPPTTLKKGVLLDSAIRASSLNQVNANKKGGVVDKFLPWSP